MARGCGSNHTAVNLARNWLKSCCILFSEVPSTCERKRPLAVHDSLLTRMWTKHRCWWLHNFDALEILEVQRFSRRRSFPIPADANSDHLTTLVIKHVFQKPWNCVCVPLISFPVCLKYPAHLPFFLSKWRRKNVSFTNWPSSWLRLFGSFHSSLTRNETAVGPFAFVLMLVWLSCDRKPFVSKHFCFRSGTGRGGGASVDAPLLLLLLNH